MESFYGGRQGNPFIIVKRFDGIDIPQPNRKNQYTYRAVYCAIDTNVPNTYLFDNSGKPITKTTENQYDYVWGIVLKDGSTLHSSRDNKTYAFPVELAEGMVQCFQQGGSSTSEVNYGEYVLIDAHSGLLEQNNVDNGKIFRRGMDYNSSLGGAEFIGNIIGPQGRCPRVDMDSYQNIIDKPTAEHDSYTPNEAELIPGYNKDTGIFNDEIQYAWVNIQDEKYNISTCLIGFKFPYLVLEITGTSVNPYGDYADGKNLVERQDDKKHPFYEKWHINVPKGIHGTDVNNLRIYGESTFSNEDISYYLDKELQIFGGTLPSSACQIQEFKNGEYASVYYGEGLVYVKTEDVKTILRYTETSYENSAVGEQLNIDIGPYNMINKVVADEDGIVSVHYTYKEPDKNIGQIVALQEAIVTKSNSYNVPENHLLVLLSDRKGTITYDSERYNEPIKGYRDLGYVKGDPGPGLAVIATYDSFQDIPTNPNDIAGYQPGYGVSVGTSFFIYDINDGKWTYIGELNDTNVENIVKVAPSGASEEDQVLENGVWLVIETVNIIE